VGSGRYRNWECLIHGGSFYHYILIQVEEFYNSFTNDDINDHAHKIHMNCRGERKVVTLQMISDLTEISLTLGLNQIPMRVEEYMILMGENCRMATHGG